MRVVFYDTAEKLALGNARRMGSLEQLLDVADIVSLHVDGRSGNAGMFGAEQFERMRPGSIFLNLSRGFVVDYGALREQILAGKIVGAAVDVFPDEPKRTGDPFDSDLRGLPNVILTPHVGGSTEEAQEGIGAFVSNKLANYVHEGTTTMSVNVPQLALEPATTARYRVTYLHRNTPGALALVNQAFRSDLRGLPNVILTPHVGGSTEEAQEGIGAFVSNKLANYVHEGTTTMSVNVPQLALEPATTARYRVTYLHRNTPGALALVNQAF